MIFLSARQKSTQKYLGEAINKAIKRDNEKRNNLLDISYQFDIVRSQDTPELSIIDYMLWALQRYILKGEDRFYNAMKHKYNLIIDVYDIENYGTNYYHRRNPFDMNKASEFRRDGYT